MKTPLKFGDEGPNITELQELLSCCGEVVLADGIFGAETLAAVRNFQSRPGGPDRAPLVVDGVVGPLTLASLQLSTRGGDARTKSTLSFSGFDLACYPGDAKMTAWRQASPYRWVGYYLQAPFHPDGSFLGQRKKLVEMGWGLAVLYAGRQSTSKPESLTREGGLRDGLETMRSVQQEGFGENTIVYLDVEPMDVLLPELKSYLKGWVSRILSSQFLPGIYSHIKNARELRVAALEEYGTENISKPLPASWVSGYGHFDAGSSVPSDSGISFAAVWQGQLNVTEEHGGVPLQIDVNVSNSASPSLALSTFAAG